MLGQPDRLEPPLLGGLGDGRELGHVDARLLETQAVVHVVVLPGALASSHWPSSGAVRRREGTRTRRSTPSSRRPRTGVVQRRGDGDLQAAQDLGPPDLVGRLGQAIQTVGHRLGGQPEPVPAVPPGHRPAQGGREWPPTSTGRGRRTGRGWASTPANPTKRPSKAGWGPAPSTGCAWRRGTRRCGAPGRRRAPRWPRTPARGSRPRCPGSSDRPTPRRARPAPWPRTTGLRWGRITIPVPSWTPVVTAARWARAISGSRMGASGASGDGGTRGSGRMTCSPHHNEP